MEILLFILSAIGAVVKFLLFAILYIILFLMIIILVILVAPIKIKLLLNIKSSDLNINIENVKGNVYITYIFKLLKINLIFAESKLNSKVKVLFWNIGDNKEKNKKNDETNKNNKKVTKTNIDKQNKNIDIINETGKNKKIETLNIEEQKNKGYESTKKINQTNSFEESKIDEQSLKSKISDILEKINYFKKYPNKKTIIQLITKYILKVLKSLKPKYINVEGKYGLNDPAHTGQLLGVFSILNSFSYCNIDLQPDFNNECVDMKVDLYISFRLWTIIVGAIVLAFKLLRLHLKSQGLTFIKFIKKLKHKKGEKDGK